MAPLQTPCDFCYPLAYTPRSTAVIVSNDEVLAHEEAYFALMHSRCAAQGKEPPPPTAQAWMRTFLRRTNLGGPMNVGHWTVCPACAEAWELEKGKLAALMPADRGRGQDS